MKQYFKSNYQECKYSPNWYGHLDFAPNATVLLYDDKNLFCIGYIEDNEFGYNALLEIGSATITGYATEEEALADIALCSIDDPDIWFGDKLLHKWDPPQDQIIHE